MTDEKLIARGYKQYERTPFDSPSVVCRFQKRFDDEKGKKYFIDAVKWGEFRHPHTGQVFPASYEYECQLYKGGSHDAFDVNFLSSWTIEEVEAFVEKIFRTCRCDYYELWD